MKKIKTLMAMLALLNMTTTMAQEPNSNNIEHININGPIDLLYDPYPSAILHIQNDSPSNENKKASISHAQDTTKTKMNKFGISVQVNTIDKFSQYDNTVLNNFGYNDLHGEWQNKSLSFGLTGIDNLNENLFLRFKSDMTTLNIVFHRDSRKDGYGTVPATNIVGDAQIKQIRYSIVPGMAWQISKNKFSGYGGFELPLNIYKSFTYIGQENDYDSTFTTVNYNGFYSYSMPGGYSFGAGAFAGFKICPLQHFYIGAEFSSAILYYHLGGNIIENVNQTIPAIYQTTGQFLYTVKGIEYAGGKLSFTITYLF